MRFLDSLGFTTKTEPSTAETKIIAPTDQARSVLLVDDSPDNRLILREYLKNSPYRVEEAYNGIMAVAMAKLRKFDFIIMDLLMPEMDGFEAMRQIRRFEDSLPPGDRACVIALTAWALREAESESFGCGADIYLTKPIRKAKLLEILAAQTAPRRA